MFLIINNFSVNNWMEFDHVKMWRCADEGTARSQGAEPKYPHAVLKKCNFA